MHRLLRLHGSRHPHEILTSAWTAVVGVIGFVLLVVTGTGISTTISRAMHEPWEYAFYVGLIVSSATVLYGVFRKKKIDGLLIERVGLFLQAAMYLVYSVVILTESGFTSLLATVLPTALVAANVIRVWQVNSDLKIIQEYLSDHPEDTALWTG